MRLAIALGERGNGRTWPNPSVGALVVRPETGEILAQGATAPGGRPHAEPIALAGAGPGARGATAFVSLEPCSHHGRTPPCAEALVAAGIARVVTAIEDPDRRVAGRGHAALRAAGLDVRIGCLAAEAERAHRGHLARIRLGRPAISLKLARTADGFAAGRPGEPRVTISGEGAGARTHMLRAHADAILVGVGTAIADDPLLDVRLPGLDGRSPRRIVVDTGLRLPPRSRLLRADASGPPIVLCGQQADPLAELILRDAGAEVLRVGTGPGGGLDLGEAMQRLGTLGLTRVLCEGGPGLADALAESDLVDDLWMLTNVRQLGRPGLPAIGPSLARAMADRFVEMRTDEVGPDRIAFYERETCSLAS